MKNKLIVANWKMNLNFPQMKKLSINIAKEKFKNKIVLAPSHLYITSVKMYCESNKNIKISAQNINENPFGAFTGEICAQMLNSVGVNYSIIGHSERRLYFDEDSDTLSKKIIQCLKNNITPIFCVGEHEIDRKNDMHFEIIEKQILSVISKLSEKDIVKLIFAYEPIWAIGTGKTATPSQAQEIHQFIRSLLFKSFSSIVANDIYILYGGSCNKLNARSLFEQNDIDGGLIGGASLNFEDFLEIVRISESF